MTMGFFGKNINDPFGPSNNQPRQSAVPAPPKIATSPPIVPHEIECAECKKLDTVIQNQTVILRNQQLIVDVILGLGKDMRDLYAPEVLPDVEPEPTPEELRDAAMELRRKKWDTTPPMIQGTILPEKKRGMPKGGWPKK